MLSVFSTLHYILHTLHKLLGGLHSIFLTTTSFRNFQAGDHCLKSTHQCEGVKGCIRCDQYYEEPTNDILPLFLPPKSLEWSTENAMEPNKQQEFRVA